MKNRTLLLGLFLTGALALAGSPVAEGAILRELFPGSKCCHICDCSFSADECSADVFDIYRPCPYDPVNCCVPCDDIGLSRGCSEHRARDLR
jgi:hypothetical protein